tara:strand:- start:352 stop:1113 length:762 start_codon:yes stop_codon:yes gene_type:complete
MNNPSIKVNLINLSSNLDIPNTILENSYALVPSLHFNFPKFDNYSRDSFFNTWDSLEVDLHMADKGKYRLRRYGVFNIDQKTLNLTFQPDSTFYQSFKTNTLNGGSNRQFSKLLDTTIGNHFLHDLIRFDFKSLPNSIICKNKFWKIGVHQIKIKSYPGSPGLPTPEGIHRDDEAFTVQHLIRKHNIAYGENLFYGENRTPSKRPKISWLQNDCFDSYYFDKSVWHSVSPIESLDGINEGYRNILLLDFVPGD